MGQSALLQPRVEADAITNASSDSTSGSSPSFKMDAAVAGDESKRIPGARP
jgi:hypothetical protein